MAITELWQATAVSMTSNLAAANHGRLAE